MLFLWAYANLGVDSSIISYQTQVYIYISGETEN